MLQLVFYLLLAAIAVIIGAGFKIAAGNAGYTRAQTDKVMGRYIIFAVVWITYVCILAGTGFLADFSLPPKMVVFVVAPAILLVVAFFTMKKTATIIASFPIALAVYYQSFRVIVEILLWGLYKEGAGPDLVTFEGYNFDILAGLSAPVVAYLAYHKKVLSHRAVIAWNMIGLLLLLNIVSIFISLIVKPALWGYAEIPVSTDFAHVPYIFVAGMFMPTAVFMHIMSIRRSITEIRKR